MKAQSSTVVSLPEAGRQGGQQGKDPSPSLGQTLLEEFEGNREHGQPMAAAVSSPLQHVQGDLSPALPHQTTRFPKRLGWSKAPGAAGPGQQSGSVLSHRLPELAPVATTATQPWVGELWTGSTAICSSHRPGTLRHEHVSGLYLPAAQLPTTCQG